MILGLMILIGLTGMGAGTAIGFIFRRDFGTSLITSSFFTSGSSSRGFFTSGCSVTGFLSAGTVSVDTCSLAKPASGFIRTNVKNIASIFSIVTIVTDFCAFQRKNRLFLLKLPDKQPCSADYLTIDLYRSDLQACCFHQTSTDPS
ncbi:hypothetical protein SAMN04488055_4830 [Chitinophaga niabensis]|uniref:Uncharacterized protein n=1 Tax=Chitinophaga niabensis TaxID=536979 RepID=A0A1N6K0R9_9BACT|nr:hypothetical protein SAMN04488055_4830 [Chitinophaga niabensis]